MVSRDYEVILRDSHMYYVYILGNATDHSLYIGFTADLKKRLSSHNKGHVISTHKKHHWKVIYYEAYLNKNDALGREKYLKSGSGWRYIKKQLFHYFEEVNSSN